MSLRERKEELAVYITVAILLILTIWFFFGASRETLDFEKATILINNSEGEKINITVEIADETVEQKQGLMHRDSLCEDCGMLFVYDENVNHGFWMKNTKIPLSIAFILLLRQKTLWLCRRDESHFHSPL